MLILTPIQSASGTLGGRRQATVQPMRELAFKTIGSVSASLIQLNIAIGNAITSSIAWLFNQISAAIANATRWLMRALDAKRYDYYQSVVTQQSELGELNLMMAARQIKEDALKARVWTSGHTVAINKIAGALHYQYGWEPPRIHKYLREVVESIPGMVYGAGDGFDEEP